MRLPNLNIGDLKIKYPIVQGAMGIRVSRSGLAAAVAREGGVGTIAAVCLGPIENAPRSEYARLNKEALMDEVRKAKEMSGGGVIAVNILVALTDFEELARGAAEAGADMIVSGAGLPLMLPEYTKGYNVKHVPIVSSGRAARIMCEKWLRRYSILPDAFVVEGNLAGGHLGFTFEQLQKLEEEPLEKIVVEVVSVAEEYGKKHNKHIPVIGAGGVFTGEDVGKMIELGAGGVQMATRFVCTEECDVSPEFKQAYLDCREEDITIIRSPLQLPGRVIRNDFVKNVIEPNEKVRFSCTYHCIRTCIPMEVPYCIAKVLINAAAGNLDEGFVFVGQNAYKCDKIVTVKELMEELVRGADAYLESKKWQPAR
ncbi:MAG: nitronate monooxygenase family protein [Elusimicrobiota bacterium]